MSDHGSKTTSLSQRMSDSFQDLVGHFRRIPSPVEFKKRRSQASTASQSSSSIELQSLGAYTLHQNVRPPSMCSLPSTQHELHPQEPAHTVPARHPYGAQFSSETFIRAPDVRHEFNSPGGFSLVSDDIYTDDTPVRHPAGAQSRSRLDKGRYQETRVPMHSAAPLRPASFAPELAESCLYNSESYG